MERGRNRSCLAGRRRLVRAWLPAALLLPVLVGAADAAELADSCIDCHRDPGFLVTDKKLYDYYR
jgi:hypothetical protein